MNSVVLRAALALALGLPPLAFAPAPLPKAPRGTPQQQALRRCEARLRELGVRWNVEQRVGRPCVRFTLNSPEDPLMRGYSFILNGDLPAALERIIGFVTSRQTDPTSGPA
jgi:hypothetical protein